MSSYTLALFIIVLVIILFSSQALQNRSLAVMLPKPAYPKGLAFGSILGVKVAMLVNNPSNYRYPLEDSFPTITESLFTNLADAPPVVKPAPPSQLDNLHQLIDLLIVKTYMFREMSPVQSHLLIGSLSDDLKGISNDVKSASKLDVTSKGIPSTDTGLPPSQGGGIRDSLPKTPEFHTPIIG